jgi:cytochrome P450
MSVETAVRPDLDAELTAYFTADPAAIAWPYPAFARWAEGSGVVRWDSGPATVVTRHRHIKAIQAGAYPVLHDGFSTGSWVEGALSRLPIEQRAVFETITEFQRLWVSRASGGDHLRLRRISGRAFTARRISALRASIQGYVDAFLAELLADPAPDLKVTLADRLPVQVICDMIGVPAEDRGRVWAWSEAIAGFMSPDSESVRAAAVALDQFRDYCGAMVSEVRRTGRGPDLALELLNGHDNDDLSEDELVAMYLLLLFGGSETTTNLIGNGFLALMRHRSQWDRLVADPSLVRGAVDELMRFDSPHQFLPRVAASGFELAGRAISAGETIIVLHAAANRDPLVFEQPDELDVTRPNRGELLSLGHGPHFCLGSALARLEGEIVFSALVERFPQIRLRDPDAHVSYRGSAMLRAIRHLPVDLGVASP